MSEAVPAASVAAQKLSNSLEKFRRDVASRAAALGYGKLTVEITVEGGVPKRLYFGEQQTVQLR